MPVLCTKCNKAFLDLDGHCVRCKRITGESEMKAVKNLPAELEEASIPTEFPTNMGECDPNGCETFLEASGVEADEEMDRDGCDT